MGDFGEVRSWVGDANPFAWGRLCTALSKWPHDARFFNEVLPYVSSHIAKWPDDVLRWSQPSWVAHAIVEGDNPLLSLCNAIRADSIGLTAEGLEVLGASEHIGEVRVLFLVGHRFDTAARRALIGSKGWTGLRDLDLRHTNTLHRDWRTLYKAAFLPGLERLWVSHEREHGRWDRIPTPFDMEPDPASREFLEQMKEKRR